MPKKGVDIQPARLYLAFAVHLHLIFESNVSRILPERTCALAHLVELQSSTLMVTGSIPVNASRLERVTRSCDFPRSNLVSSLKDTESAYTL